MGTLKVGLVALVGSAAASLSGQVVLDQSNSAPVVGDSYIREWGGSITDVPPIPGSPPLYDYSGELPAGPPDTVSFTAPTDGVWCSAWIPGADVEICDGWAGPDGNGRYYIPTPTGLVLMGAFDDAAYLFADQKLDMPYPCSAGTTWTDDYAGADLWGTDRQIYGTIDGVAITECDVLTPDGLYAGALRVETTTVQDRHENGSLFSHMEHSLIAYHVPGIHLPVLWIHNATYDDIQGTQFNLSSGFWLQGALSTGAPDSEERTQVRVWPNPVLDQAFVDARTVDAVGFQVLDALGRTVATGTLTGGRARVDMAHLPAGTYTLKLGGAEPAFVRLVKQ